MFKALPERAYKELHGLKDLYIKSPKVIYDRSEWFEDLIDKKPLKPPKELKVISLLSKIANIESTLSI